MPKPITLGLTLVGLGPPTPCPSSIPDCPHPPPSLGTPQGGSAPSPAPTFDVAPLTQGLQRRPPLQELAEFVPDFVGVALAAGTARCLPGHWWGRGSGHRCPKRPGCSRHGPRTPGTLCGGHPTLPSGWLCWCHPGAHPCARMPELTCLSLLAAPQLHPGAEFSPALGILLAGEVGALGKGQHETPVPIPGVAGRGVAGACSPACRCCRRSPSARR